ncbi:hypothetical protein [Ruficoccus sp. ZRK36]|uniref:hypothetical protein n=1 Tax=Ruficoccus sp. ZRK36 TaxID=2866311 RepID=UPI001C73C95B|nr:hypothetical protein [Ruficoccus sp. ZRK36]QYY34741.1 hypothetical protein K0V07_10555 [Ruficoccus sp. ZRK36]
MSFLLRKLFLAAVLSVAATALAHAELTYSVDSVNKLITFTGTATGTPEFGLIYDEVSWSIDTIVGGESTGGQANLSSPAISSSNSSISDGPYLDCISGVDSGAYILLTLSLDSDTETTLTAGGLSFYYGGTGSSSVAYIDSLTTSEIPFEIEVGTGFGSITYATVPEPVHYSAAVMVGMLAFCLSRRVYKKRTAR